MFLCFGKVLYSVLLPKKHPFINFGCSGPRDAVFARMFVYNYVCMSVRVLVLRLSSVLRAKQLKENLRFCENEILHIC